MHKHSVHNSSQKGFLSGYFPHCMGGAGRGLQNHNPTPPPTSSLLSGFTGFGVRLHQGKTIKQHLQGTGKSPDPYPKKRLWERMDPRELVPARGLEATNDPWRWDWPWDRSRQKEQGPGSESLPPARTSLETHTHKEWIPRDLPWPQCSPAVGARMAVPSARDSLGRPCPADRWLFWWSGIFILLCFL